jgi:Matrixin
MNISWKLVIISITILLLFSFFNNEINLSFAKSQDKNGFVNKNVIPICCAWGPELKGGVLTYSIQGGSNNLDTAVTKAVELWNQNLKGMQFVKTTNGTENIIVSFTKDGKKVAGKTINSVDSDGLIRKSFVTLSKKSFGHQFSSSQMEQVAEHEFGHVLGLNHANFNGNLMSSRVDIGSGTISTCVIEAVNTANAWKLIEGGVSIHTPTQNYVTC